MLYVVLGRFWGYYLTKQQLLSTRSPHHKNYPNKMTTFLAGAVENTDYTSAEE